MPIPFILAAAAVIAGTVGVGLGVHGGKKMHEASDKLKRAQSRDRRNNERLESMNQSACQSMDTLGKNEIQALASFKDFADLFEKIKNRPQFAQVTIGKVSIPKFDGESIKKASIGASVLIGGLGGTALGTAGGFAASGATTAAVMALGTASTGTAISTLSGAAATNATLAALGGGSLAAGGGGIALGTTLLGAATLGVGLLVGGAIFSFTGSKLSDQADEAWDQMLANESKIDSICSYLQDLKQTADSYNSTLQQMMNIYNKQLSKMYSIIEGFGGQSVEWGTLSKEEKLDIENTVLIVGILYNMCKVQLVQKSESTNLNKINKEEISKAQTNAQEYLAQTQALLPNA